MILTPVHADELPRILDTFDRGLGSDEFARSVFRRIAGSRALCPNLVADLHAGRAKAIDLAARFRIPTLDEDPATAFSWDGKAIRTRSETSVVFHEIAHWLIAAPERRALPDFGVGAGPETGRVDEANAAMCVDTATREEEENLSSLLGILWEVEYAEPAIIAFAEQNWLELYDRPSTPAHFARCLHTLADRGLVTRDGRPVQP